MEFIGVAHGRRMRECPDVEDSDFPHLVNDAQKRFVVEYPAMAIVMGLILEGISCQPQGRLSCVTRLV